MILFVYYSLMLIGVLALSIWFHELGHYLYFLKMLDKKVKLHVQKKGLFGVTFLVGESKDYVGLSDKQYFNLCGWGVFIGLIPMLMLSGFLVSANLLGVTFCLYVLGSVKDIRNMITYLKENKKVFKYDE